MLIDDFLPIWIQVALACSIAVGILLASHLLGQRARTSKIGNSPYECGMLPAQARAHPRFTVRFYIMAMLFIIFDIEVAFLIPWAVAHRSLVAHGLALLGPILFFLGLIAVGWWYEKSQGVNDWSRN
jgi:NADH-quinone oxidoreductase subunit A